ncbi:MAG TPA: hypothetical protein VH701_18735 [Vicinamibacterales bacterium]|jgi:hypothetical protein
MDDHEATAPHVRLTYVHLHLLLPAVVALSRVNVIHRDGNSPVDQRQRKTQENPSLVVSVRA